jgi:vacuolar-type H+-ATPase subunit F/Vma7
MPQVTEHTGKTRMIFMGAAALTDGFRLIGFETRADPAPQDVEKLLRELVNRRHSAFVVLDQDLSRQEIPMLERVRSEGGHIVICTVPPLNDPDRFATRIDDRLQMMLGGGGLI